jgi:hypothetical protein
LDRESREYKKDMDEVGESNKDLDMHSTHLMKKSRELIGSPTVIWKNSK